jgi:hypothetical protein
MAEAEGVAQVNAPRVSAHGDSPPRELHLEDERPINGEDSGLEVKLTQVATYKIPANFLKLWAKMNPHTLSTKPWRVVA